MKTQKSIHKQALLGLKNYDPTKPDESSINVAKSVNCITDASALSCQDKIEFDDAIASIKEKGGINQVSTWIDNNSIKWKPVPHEKHSLYSILSKYSNYDVPSQLWKEDYVLLNGIYIEKQKAFTIYKNTPLGFFSRICSILKLMLMNSYKPSQIINYVSAAIEYISNIHGNKKGLEFEQILEPLCLLKTYVMELLTSSITKTSKESYHLTQRMKGETCLLFVAKYFTFQSKVLSLVDDYKSAMLMINLIVCNAENVNFLKTLINTLFMVGYFDESSKKLYGLLSFVQKADNCSEDMGMFSCILQTLRAVLKYLCMSISIMKYVNDKNKESYLIQIYDQVDTLVSPIYGALPKYLLKIAFEDIEECSPFTIQILKSTLKFIKNVYELPAKCSLMHTNDYSTFYVRTIFSNFIKLYNKYIDEYPPYFKVVIHDLAISHLQTLINISIFRSEDTIRTFYGLKIVSFLTGEIDLEYHLLSNSESPHDITEDKSISIDKSNFNEKPQDSPFQHEEINISPIKQREKETTSHKSSIELAVNKSKVHKKDISMDVGDKEKGIIKVNNKKLPNLKLNLSKVKDNEKKILEKSSDRKIEENISHSENANVPPRPTYIPSTVNIRMQRDRNDKGVIVGCNKAFVPFLYIPTNIESYKEDGDAPPIPDKKLESKFIKPKLVRRAKGGLTEGLSNTNDKSISEVQPSKDESKLEDTKEEIKEAPVNIVHKLFNGVPLKIPKIDIEKANQNKIASYKERYDQVYKESLQANDIEVNKIEQEWAEGKSKLHLMIQNKSYENNQRKSNRNEGEDIIMERAKRAIYSNHKIHVYSLALLFSLLLNNGRGTLESLYCSTNPIDNDMENVLYLLHFHINHPMNEPSISELSIYFNADESPKVGCMRLLKMLCRKLLNISIYSGWERMGGGAYGNVYKCNVSLECPKVVAIKKMIIPKTIYDRSVLHDIFSEITALELLQKYDCATELFDYGVGESEYFIIMKKFDSNLRTWRLSQQRSLTENLPLYFGVFNEILKSVEILHSNRITHYDLKCENVMIELGEDSFPKKVSLGDFGDCHLFLDESSEYCAKTKGTDYIKSPEMLLLPMKEKKDTDKYDRRINNGTTRASDIWSLGCVFFELLTGKFLFSSENYFVFHAKVTTPTEDLIEQEQIEVLENNVYLIDFLKFILVREQKLRPNITNTIKRFNNLQELLINGNIFQEKIPQANTVFESSIISSLAEQLTKMDIPSIKSTSSISRTIISDTISIVSMEHLQSHPNKYSHIISYSAVKQHIDNAKCLSIDKSTSWKGFALFMDFLREAIFSKGKLAIIHDESEYATLISLMSQCANNGSKGYSIWNYFKMRAQFVDLSISSLKFLCNWSLHECKIKAQIEDQEKYSCACGKCTLLLIKDTPFVEIKCKCKQNKNINHRCPSNGCADYIKYSKYFLKKTYDMLTWKVYEGNVFTIGPADIGQIKHEECKRLILDGGGMNNSIVLYSIRKSAPEDYDDQEHIWSMYGCTNCHEWVCAVCKPRNKVALLMCAQNSTYQKISQSYTIA